MSLFRPFWGGGFGPVYLAVRGTSGEDSTYFRNAYGINSFERLLALDRVAVTAAVAADKLGADNNLKMCVCVGGWGGCE